jgi:hypothetical protein
VHLLVGQTVTVVYALLASYEDGPLAKTCSCVLHQALCVPCFAERVLPRSWSFADSSARDGDLRSLRDLSYYSSSSRTTLTFMIDYAGVIGRNELSGLLTEENWARGVPTLGLARVMFENRCYGTCAGHSAGKTVCRAEIRGGLHKEEGCGGNRTGAYAVRKAAHRQRAHPDMFGAGQLGECMGGR